MPTPHPPAIVLFDGVCNLCNSTVSFLLRRDPHGRFRFASLQSEVGQKLLYASGLAEKNLDSIVLIDEKGRAHWYSGAALRIAWRLGGAWRLLFVGMLVPYFIRDFIYKWVARNRYRWFGKREACMLPRPEWKTRFL